MNTSQESLQSRKFMYVRSILKKHGNKYIKKILKTFSCKTETNADEFRQI